MRCPELVDGIAIKNKLMQYLAFSYKDFFRLYTGTVEQGSPYIILFETGCKRFTNSDIAKAGWATLEHPLMINLPSWNFSNSIAALFESINCFSPSASSPTKPSTP